MAKEEKEEKWIEHLTKDGKKYYFNNITKETSWLKPEEISIVNENSFSPWNKFFTPDGKKYYHNCITNKTEWKLPEEYRFKYKNQKKLQQRNYLSKYKQSFTHIIEDNWQTTFEIYLSILIALIIAFSICYL